MKSLENSTPYEFLAGDLNLLEITGSIQHLVNDAYVYHYQTEDPQTVILNDLKDELRMFVSVRDLDHLLNVERANLERDVQDLFTGGHRKDPALASAELIKINLLEIQPVVDTMNAFREISSSQDDRERIIVNAQKYLVTMIHMAHGNAAYEIERASCEAFRNVHVAVAETKAIQLVSERGLALGAGQAQLAEQVRQAELLGGPQGGVLDADRARPRQLERVDVDALEIGLPGVLRRGIRRRRGNGIRRGNGERNSVPQEAFDDALGLGLDRGVALDRQQFCVGVENPLDAVAEGAPVVLLDGEMAAEVEERALADLVADALGADEAEGEVGTARLTGEGQGARVSRSKG